MNKYLKGLINLPLKLLVAYVGLTFSVGVLVASFWVFPIILMRADQALTELANSQTFYFDGSLVIYEIIRHVVGLIPLYALVAFLSFSVFSMFLTIRLVKKTDIELIIKELFPKTNGTKRLKKVLKRQDIALKGGDL